MSETKPLILIKKYRSILFAAIIIEVVTFFVSLTDTIVAANFVGRDAFAAVGLMSPFFSIATFVTAVINSGTTSNYSFQIGRFDQDRAHRIFSEGVIMAVASGLILTISLILLRNNIVSALNLTPSTQAYLIEYYRIIVFYFMLAPISALLDNIVVADGGERLSTILNSLQIIGNVVLSVVLAYYFGVRGIAAATVLCKTLFVLFICFWFLGKKNTLRFKWFLSLRDTLSITSKGLVRAMTFAMTAIMTIVLNAFILKYYDTNTFEVWIIVQKILGLSSIFMGLSITMQPVLGSLNGENNTKAIRVIAERAGLDLLIAGLVTSIPLVCLPSLALWIFDVKQGPTYDQGLIALRLTGFSLIFVALTVFFFIYFFIMEQNLLALIVCVLKDLIFPAGLVLAFGTLLGGSPLVLWIALALSPVAVLLSVGAALWLIYGRTLFPFLLSRERDDITHIFAFDISDENIVRMSRTAGELIKKNNYSRRTQNMVSLCIEEVLKNVLEKNSSSDDSLLSECTLTMEDRGVLLIIRETGKLFDITDLDADIDSFFHYIASTIINAIDFKSYVTTTGYNRTQLFFENTNEE